MNLAPSPPAPLPQAGEGGERLPRVLAASGARPGPNHHRQRFILVGAPALDEDHGISGLTGPLQAIQFSRSIPGVASVLVGMTQPAHWAQNTRLFALTKADLWQSIKLRRMAKNRPPDQSTPKGPLPILAMAVHKEFPV